MMHPNCPLCNSISTDFYEHKKRRYFLCTLCFGIFIDSAKLLSREEEKARYQLHNNDVENEGYQNFVSPITSAIMRDFNKTHTGLDFGAGSGPVISKILTDNGYQIKQYDPFFHNYADLLNQKYDYIACCEVMEHFYYPYKEFKLLKNLLSSIGKLYCYTSIYDSTLNFPTWYYKNDSTHVFFYQKQTILWIQEEFGFTEVKIDGKLITFFA